MARGFFGAKASDPNAGNERERQCPIARTEADRTPIRTTDVRRELATQRHLRLCDAIQPHAADPGAVPASLTAASLSATTSPSRDAAGLLRGARLLRALSGTSEARDDLVDSGAISASGPPASAAESGRRADRRSATSGDPP